MGEPVCSTSVFIRNRLPSGEMAYWRVPASLLPTRVVKSGRAAAGLTPPPGSKSSETAISRPFGVM
jgi:hypothetical protein